MSETMPQPEFRQIETDRIMTGNSFVLAEELSLVNRQLAAGTELTCTGVANFSPNSPREFIINGNQDDKIVTVLPLQISIIEI